MRKRGEETSHSDFKISQPTKAHCYIFFWIIAKTGAVSSPTFLINRGHEPPVHQTGILALVGPADFGKPPQR